MGVLLFATQPGCDLFEDSSPANKPPTGPTPPPSAPQSPSQAEPVEEVKEEVEEEKASSEVFDLISKRVHQCGADANCTVNVGKQLEKVNDASVRALIPVISGSASIQIRSESMRMLAQRKIEDAIPTIINVLLKEKELELQEAAALALRDIGNPVAVKALTTALENAENLRMKEIYIRALGGFRTEEAVTSLTAAGEGAGRDLFLTTVAAMGATRQPAAVPFLTKAMTNEDVFIQLEAVHALSGIISQSAVDALRDISQKPGLSNRVRERAKKNLADLKKELDSLNAELEKEEGVVAEQEAADVTDGSVKDNEGDTDAPSEGENSAGDAK